MIQNKHQLCPTTFGSNINEFWTTILIVAIKGQNYNLDFLFQKPNSEDQYDLNTFPNYIFNRKKHSTFLSFQKITNTTTHYLFHFAAKLTHFEFTKR